MGRILDYPARPQPPSLPLFDVGTQPPTQTAILSALECAFLSACELAPGGADNVAPELLAQAKSSGVNLGCFVAKLKRAGLIVGAGARRSSSPTRHGTATWEWTLTAAGLTRLSTLRRRANP